MKDFETCNQRCFPSVVFTPSVIHPEIVLNVFGGSLPMRVTVSAFY